MEHRGCRRQEGTTSRLLTFSWLKARPAYQFCIVLRSSRRGSLQKWVRFKSALTRSSSPIAEAEACAGSRHGMLAWHACNPGFQAAGESPDVAANLKLIKTPDLEWQDFRHSD